MSNTEVPYNPTMADDPTRSHHGGNKESEAAFEASNKENWVELTYLALLTAGLRGSTPEEVADYWSGMLGREVSVLTIRPRFTTLLKEKRIRRTTQKRESALGGSSRVCTATIYNPIEYREPDERDAEADIAKQLYEAWKDAEF